LSARAIAAYSAATELLSHLDSEIEEDLEELTRCDSRGQLVGLKTATTERRLWQLGDDAKYQLRRLPAPGDVIASLRALEVDRETKPSLETVLDWSPACSMCGRSTRISPMSHL
jgi:hypothetical protein